MGYNRLLTQLSVISDGQKQTGISRADLETDGVQVDRKVSREKK